MKEVQEIAKLATFVYVRQPMPLGDGHAVLCAKDIIGDEPFAIMFGDDIVDGPKPALKQLIEAYEKTESSVIALEKIDPNDTEKYGIADPAANTHTKDDLLNQLKGFVEKPKPEEAPSNLGIIGKYVVTPEIINALESATPGKDGEIRLIDGFMQLKKTQKIYGYEIQGKRYDTGHKLGLIEATIDFALKKDDLGHA